MKKVLILTASYGTGHVMVAKALDEAFRKKGIEPVVIDLVEKGGKTEKFGASFYSFLMRRGHFIWKFYHEKIMPIRKGDSIRAIYKRLNKGKLFQEIENINPDIIISTIDQASVVASLFKERHPDVKIATVLTDYVIHPIWVWENMDSYFIGSEEIQQYLIKHKIPKEKIHMTGIPIRSQFEKSLPQKDSREELGIPADRTTILLSVGSFGSVPIHEVLQALQGRTDLFFIILAGEKVSDFAQMLQENALIGKVVGYAENMEVFMSASNLLVSKAGGVTTAECFNQGLPAVYVNNFPGHEIGNAEYARKNGAARIAKNTTELKEILLELLGNADKLEGMEKKAQKLSTPHAAEHIVKTLL